MKKNVLITGSTGMLGKDIARIFLDDPQYQVFGIDIIRNHGIEGIKQWVLDLTDANKLLQALHEISPKVIVHCAAIVDVDGCEKDHSMADKLHKEATKNLASFNPKGIRFIYISTDSVYPGEKGNYSETDMVAPLNYYAKSKYEGEQAALINNPDAVIMRTNIYGFNFPKHNSLVEWAMKNWEEGRQINGFEDVYFNPLYTKQLARIVKKASDDPGSFGILNAGSNDPINKYQFLLSLAKVMGYEERMIKKSSVKEMGFSAPRPLNTTMNINRLKNIIGEVPGLITGLEQLKADLK